MTSFILYEVIIPTYCFSEIIHSCGIITSKKDKKRRKNNMLNSFSFYWTDRWFKTCQLKNLPGPDFTLNKETFSHARTDRFKK